MINHTLRALRLILPAAALVAVLSPLASAQTYGEARAHAHGPTVQVEGLFVSRDLVQDPVNTGGDAFFGNTLTISLADGRRETFFRAWADNWMQTLQFFATVTSSTVLRVKYDPACRMALSVEVSQTSPAGFVRPVMTLVPIPQPTPAATPQPTPSPASGSKGRPVAMPSTSAPAPTPPPAPRPRPEPILRNWRLLPRW